MISRRHLIRLGLAGVAQQLLPAPEGLFEEITPTASGIKWVHENAMSDRRHLPETFGPGCAFLDYDNDGWMDILLVNSGPSRLFQAKKAAQSCSVQEQSRRYIYRCNGTRGAYGRIICDGSGGWRLRQRRTPRYPYHGLWRPCSVSQQWRRHLHRCDREIKAQRAGMDHERCLVRL